MTDRRDMSGTSNYLHWGNETAFATNTITTSLEHGVITFGKRVVLEGAGPIGDVASIVFSLQEASVDGITTRDYLTVLAGAAAGTAAVAVLGASTPLLAVLAVGFSASWLAEKASGTIYDYMYDSGATPVQPSPIIVEQSRQSRITSTDSGIQARYDNPQYDAQTADGRGVTRAYVDAYAQGDLKAAAQLLVGHGANIYPGAANGFYADQVIRQMAGYAGGITPVANQTRARDIRDAMGNDGDPNTYPDAIIRNVAAPTQTSASSAVNSVSTSSGGGRPDRDQQGGGGTSAGSGGSGGGGSNSGWSGGGGTVNTKTNTSVNTSNHPPGGGRADRDQQGGGSTVKTDKTAKEDRRPVLLDLDGNGVKITVYQNATQFMTGKDGLQHRTAWAGAGDGVLFIDADGDGEISTLAEYVFTEWDCSASDDMEAMRRVFDTDGDGKLTEVDARWGERPAGRFAPWTVFQAKPCGGDVFVASKRKAAKVNQRLRAICGADRIIVMDQGRVVSRRAHEAILIGQQVIGR